MKTYKVAVNLELTSKCNARCIMCPQELIERPQLMTAETFYKALERINTNDVFRAVIAGYGEPTTHPRFMEFISAVGDHPGRFDMVSNGHLLDEKKLRHLDGKIDLLVVSFSSIDADVYRGVHVKLDHERVKTNIAQAGKLLKKTSLAISLTPLVECIETLPETIEWLRKQGVGELTMSPTLYNRAGTMEKHEQATQTLRRIIQEYRLHSQELDFIPSVKDIALQFWHNRFRCIPRNSDLFITASGDYLYCYNDISHKHTFGHIDQLSVRQALNKREKMNEIPEICTNCNMRNRYRVGEVTSVAAHYLYGKVTKIAMA
ncbi:MAG: radical SAM protein [Gammaproteobacteria bacterium]|nr:radical SAM protein [Gammaproteobacteria bacterium]